MSAKKFENSMSLPEEFATDIVVGLVGPVGCGLSKVEAAVTQALRRFSYDATVLKLSSLFDDAEVAPLVGGVNHDCEYSRLKTAMDAGDEWRSRTGRSDVMAIYAMSKICEARLAKMGDAKPMVKVAHIIHSLKRPEEVRSLRTVYGQRFILVGVYVPRGEREDALVKRGMSEVNAKELVVRDEQGGGMYGQAASDAFQLADLIVDGRAAPDSVEAEIQRFLDLLFGVRLITPSLEEHSMHLAFAASLRSGDLSRQVGAVIVDARGAVLATGCNDAPRFGGGQYWPGPDDARDIVAGEDANERIRRQALRAMLESVGRMEAGRDEFERAQEVFGDNLLMDLTEFGRAVHAEMAALMDCARRGVRTEGSAVFCTTFPCHNCVKHLVAAGVEKLYFIEPYAKSRALELHGDAVSADELVERRLRLLPFVGIGPRRFQSLFALQDPVGNKIKRKGRKGTVLARERAGAVPMISEGLASYLEREQAALGEMVSIRKRLKLASKLGGVGRRGRPGRQVGRAKRRGANG